MGWLTILAIVGMAGATFACRAGGYLVFRRLRPGATVQAALGFIPGALFVSYVAPALSAGGGTEWVGAAAVLTLMIRTGNLSLAILGGTAVAWAWWSIG